MKIYIPIEIQFFPGSDCRISLQGVAEAVQPPGIGASSIKGTGKPLPSCRVVCNMAASFILSVFLWWSKQSSWPLFFPLKPTNSAGSTQTLVAAAAQPLLPCPCLLGGPRVSRAQPGKHPSNFCRWREGRYLSLARSHLHPSLPSRHQQLTPAFRHLVNLLRLIPANLLYPDSLSISQ